MKNRIFGILAICLALGTGCAESKVIDGRVYQPYGLIDEDQVRDPCVEYRASTENVIWGILLVETVVAPVLLFGYELYEPVGKRQCD